METTVLTKSEALKKKAKGKKGFTLVELVVVIAVLAIIAVIAVPMVSGVVKNANESADKSNAQSLEVTLKSAAAQIQAGTAPVSSTDKVSTVLSKYGIAGGIPKPKESTVYFSFTKDGGISVKAGSGGSSVTDDIANDPAISSVYTCS